jgi:hypothetical protein
MSAEKLLQTNYDKLKPNLAVRTRFTSQPKKKLCVKTCNTSGWYFDRSVAYSAARTWPDLGSISEHFEWTIDASCIVCFYIYISDRGACNYGGETGIYHCKHKLCCSRWRKGCNSKGNQVYLNVVMSNSQGVSERSCCKHSRGGDCLKTGNR